MRRVGGEAGQHGRSRIQGDHGRVQNEIPPDRKRPHRPHRIQPDVPDPHRTLGRGEGLFEARNRPGNLRQLQASVGVQQWATPFRSRADWVGFQERDLSQVGGVAGITLLYLSVYPIRVFSAWHEFSELKGS